MKLSNPVKRNISLTLLIVGIMCIIGRIWEIVMDPTSVKLWFELVSIIILTYICFDRFRVLQKRVRQGIIFGTR
ncbi:MAG: hypothetical protein K2H47_07800 [Muribaculaceae bacterium]|nr:hypothetical protein [Muribaculaceae bacterium]